MLILHVHCSTDRWYFGGVDWGWKQNGGVKLIVEECKYK